ncbi:hypothetical protein NQ315_012827 [Exocentrus adspersus]|uniref:Transposase n=1 Tax=Exocentrus adspersus TaxID=1586481 RepID=A0AAV8V836_9CUCU|nr:hypothetical protein NQ315_012827 [Exocentrus adspersus]
MNYSKEELVNMVYAIGEAHGNCLLASRIYQANNPDLQRYPLTKCFVKQKERFERTANANYEKTARTHACSNQDRQIDIVGCAIQNPSTSIREISDEISISKSVVYRTFNFHPYNPEHHQFLTEQDCQKRVQFCECYLLMSHPLPTLVERIDIRINHYADQNPRLMRQDDHQHRFKVNVWAGICGEYVIGPHFFEGNLTGNGYLQFLQNDLLQLQRHIPPDDLNSQWFQHDGAPAHSTLAVRNISNKVVGVTPTLKAGHNTLTDCDCQKVRQFIFGNSAFALFNKGAVICQQIPDDQSNKLPFFQSSAITDRVRYLAVCYQFPSLMVPD